MLLRWLMTLVALLALPVEQVQAQGFPSRPLRIIVGLTPGSAGDSAARFLAAHLPPLLGQPVIVENRAGGNGVIAVQAVLGAPADGHTLFLASNSPMSVNPVMLRNLPYRPERDLTPVTGIFRTANMFVVPAQSSYKSLADVVTAGRKAVTQLDIATYSQGYWLVAAWFAQAAGIRFSNIPYKGMAPTLADVVGNHVGLALVDQSGVGALVSERKLRALAITSDSRHPRFPEVPTVRESGYADFSHYSWGALYVATGTPDAAVAKLTAAAHKVLATAEARTFLQQQGLESHALGPPAMRKFHLEQLERYRQIAATAGIQAQ